MSGIAGMARGGETEQVSRMLARIAHRGHESPEILRGDHATLGMISNSPDTMELPATFDGFAVWDGPQPPLPLEEALRLARGGFALAAAGKQGLFLARDPLGVRPLYYGRARDDTLCFASEVKALLGLVETVHEFPPGYWLDAGEIPHRFHEMTIQPAEDLPEELQAERLRALLEQAVLRRIDSPVMGGWLSGGLDSSAMAALAHPHLERLHTFAGGLEGAPDVLFASQVAHYLQTEHHEVIVTARDLMNALPRVILHLESFDALLVRSTLVNFLVAERASNFVGSAFSGEGGDELFGGYDYLKNLPTEKLPCELLDITRRLHNTALQRVDRSASAHGLVVHVPLLDLDVVEFTLRIPPRLKIRQDDKVIEKYIFRLAMKGSLPEEVLWRPKAKFWQGAGVDTLLAQHADETITDRDFANERVLPNGWRLNTKEELMYHRIFREHFGEMTDLNWMGRTKGAPVI